MKRGLMDITIFVSLGVVAAAIVSSGCFLAFAAYTSTGLVDCGQPGSFKYEAREFWLSIYEEEWTCDFRAFNPFAGDFEPMPQCTIEEGEK